MKASDLVLVDSEGYVVEGGNQAVVNTAGFMIHSAVHKARPDALAAAHAHSVHGKTWSAFGRPVEMITQGMTPPPRRSRLSRVGNRAERQQMRATFSGSRASTMTTEGKRSFKRRDRPSQPHSVKIIWSAF